MLKSLITYGQSRIKQQIPWKGERISKKFSYGRITEFTSYMQQVNDKSENQTIVYFQGYDERRISHPRKGKTHYHTPLSSCYDRFRSSLTYWAHNYITTEGAVVMRQSQNNGRFRCRTSTVNLSFIESSILLAELYGVMIQKESRYRWRSYLHSLPVLNGILNISHTTST